MPGGGGTSVSRCLPGPIRKTSQSLCHRVRCSAIVQAGTGHKGDDCPSLACGTTTLRSPFGRRRDPRREENYPPAHGRPLAPQFLSQGCPIPIPTPIRTRDGRNARDVKRIGDDLRRAGTLDTSKRDSSIVPSTRLSTVSSRYGKASLSARFLYSSGPWTAEHWGMGKRLPPPSSKAETTVAVWWPNAYTGHGSRLSTGILFWVTRGGDGVSEGGIAPGPGGNPAG